jgi:hypothetical protein
MGVNVGGAVIVYMENLSRDKIGASLGSIVKGNWDKIAI